MNALATAARRTLEEESARVTRENFWHPPHDDLFTGTSGEGVVDFRLERTYVRESGWWGRQLVRRIVEDHPWISSKEPEEDKEDPPVDYVYADGESFRGSSDTWRRVELDTRSASDPIALLERLAACDVVHPRDGCFGFLITEGRSRLYGDAWVDEEGRVVRVTYRLWTPRRTKQKAKHEFWTTLELTDFGRPVAIEIPEIDEEDEDVEYSFDPWGIVSDLGRLARGAWRMFRRWRAFKRAAATG